ncbi:PucR family transcriptional regulator [Nocardioides caldifontis]|uniref:PucR family transcriptional regulator n=1 Tax=Nocardioides caldifontis TaxID=2588938 RepID=UPI0011DF5D3C|nr:PucR family transcriptional regulator [Nocardioides caldifontis]
MTVDGAVELSPQVTDACGAMPERFRGHLESLSIEGLVDEVLQRCTAAAFSEHAHDAEFVERLRASISQNAYALRDVLVGRASLDEVELDKVLEFASTQARLRIPQKAMQRSYRVSFLSQWEIWAHHLRDALVGTEVSTEEALDLLSRLTRAILTYQDHVASRVADTYTRDQDALNRSRAHVRKNLVRDVLRGEAGSLSASDLALLAYPLDAHHVAVLLPEMPEGAASQLADGLRSAGRCPHSLTYALTLGSTVVWLGRLDPWPQAALTAVVEALERVGAVATVSNPARGADGFVTALRQARDAERVREAWPPEESPAVVRYSDANLEILLLRDEALARAFVETELGPLGRSTNEATRLRDTLEASFRFGSHVAAAEHLQLHEHTVRNRLHKAEELLGHPLQERRTELQVAIRLVRLLGDG